MRGFVLMRVRAGLMALPRSPLHGTEQMEMEAQDVVDVSQLPPG